MHKKYGFIFLTVSAAFVFLAGCALLEKKDPSNSSLIEPQPIVRFADVPVPAGFKLLPQDSFSFENQGTRVGILKYRGKANPDQITLFYKEQMVMARWNLLNVVEYGERQLNFDRESETCVVTLIPKGSSVTITIAVGPKSTTASKKVEKPVK